LSNTTLTINDCYHVLEATSYPINVTRLAAHDELWKIAKFNF